MPPVPGKGPTGAQQKAVQKLSLPWLPLFLKRKPRDQEDPQIDSRTKDRQSPGPGRPKTPNYCLVKTELKNLFLLIQIHNLYTSE